MASARGRIRGIVLAVTPGRLRALSARLGEVPWALACQILTSATSFLTTVAFARTLDLGSFGILALCLVVLVVARNFLTQVLLAPMSTIAPDVAAADERYYAGFLLAGALVFALSIGVGTGLALAAAAPVAGIAEPVPVALALGIANSFSLLADYGRRFEFVLGKPWRAFAMDLGRNVVQLVAIVVVIAPFGPSPSAQTALYAVALGGLTGCLVAAVGHPRPGWSRRLAAAMWCRHRAFLLWMSPGFVFETLQYNGPFLFAAGAVGAEAVGLARALQQLANILALPINALQHIATARAKRAQLASGFGGARRFLLRLTAASGGFIGFLSAALLLLQEPLIVGIFGVYRPEAWPILLAYLALNLTTLVRFPFMIAAQVGENPRLISSAAVVGAATATITVLMTADRLGGLSIPLSVVAAMAANLVVYAWAATYAHRGDRAASEAQRRLDRGPDAAQ